MVVRDFKGATSLVTHTSEIKRPMVLLVDDHLDSVILAEHIVEEAGFLTARAFSGCEAIAQALELKPDLILLDIQLPDIDRLDVFEELQHHTTVANVPVVALTASFLSTRQRQTIAKKFSGMLLKPYNIEDLERLILEVLAPLFPEPQSEQGVTAA